MCIRDRKPTGLSACMSARTSPEPHARFLPIYLCMLSRAVARPSSGRVTKSQGERGFWGLSRPFVCQASANRNPKNSERRRCGLSAGKGWWECTPGAKSDIYSLVACCFCHGLVAEYYSYSNIDEGAELWRYLTVGVRLSCSLLNVYTKLLNVY